MMKKLLLTALLGVALAFTPSMIYAHDSYHKDGDRDRGDRGRDWSDHFSKGTRDENRNPTACSDVAETLGWMAYDAEAWSHWKYYLEYPKCLHRKPPVLHHKPY